MAHGSDYLLPLITIILLVIFAVWAIWYYYSSPEQLRTNSSGTGQGQDIYATCPAGQCATSLINGVKDCPASSTDTVQYNITTQVCNSPNLCDNVATPYAMDANYGTNLTGKCTINQCQCLTQPQCPAYITSYFIAENGRPYYPLDNSRISFQQSTTYVDGAKQIQTTGPYVLPFNSVNYCSLPIQWLPRLFPHDCVNGVLAILAPDPNQVFLSNVAQFPFSCVVGNNCPVGSTPVWDTSNNILTCKSLCPNGEQPRWDPTTKTVSCVAV